MRYSVLRIMAFALLAFVSSVAAAQPTSRPTATIWQTTFGDMRLDVSPSLGELKRIPYRTDNGRLIGRFSRGADGVLNFEGTWVEDDSSRPCSTQVDGSAAWGRLSLQFSSDHSRFEGNWGYCDEAFSAYWTGTNTNRGGPPDFPRTTTLDEEPARQTASLDALIERLRLEARRAGPRPAGAPEITESRLQELRTRIEGMDIPDGDLAQLIDAHFGAGDAFDPDKSSDFEQFANRMRVPRQLQDAAREFDSGLQELVGVPPEVVRALHDGFYQSDTLHRDGNSRTYGTSYHGYVLDRLQNDDTLRNKLGEEARGRLAALTDPDQFEPSVRARTPTDRVGSDCSYDAVVARMRMADPRFAFQYDAHVLYGRGTGRSNAMRERVRGAVLDAIRLCEQGRGI